MPEDDRKKAMLLLRCSSSASLMARTAGVLMSGTGKRSCLGVPEPYMPSSSTCGTMQGQISGAIQELEVSNPEEVYWQSSLRWRECSANSRHRCRGC